jgi:hypothetical protein
MCDRIVVLAQLDHRRWISCCEHGTTHLTWDSVSLRIPIQRLKSMNHALQECAQVARTFRIAGTGEVCVIFDQYDLYQLWLSGVGFCLTPDEFHLFCQLIASAGRHPKAHVEESEPDIPLAQSPIRTTFHLFSPN